MTWMVCNIILGPFATSAAFDHARNALYLGSGINFGDVAVSFILAPVSCVLCACVCVCSLPALVQSD